MSVSNVIPARSGPAASRVMRVRGKTLVIDGAPKMVGILNITPDSFFDGRPDLSAEAALQRALQMVAEGAAIIDVGGQSTRPGFVELEVTEEIARVIPVIELLAANLTVPISIDTYKPAVACAAVEAGADIVNDIHGFQQEPELAKIAAEHHCGVILMHNDAGFRNTAGNTVERVAGFFARSIDIARTAGVEREQLILDPGIGFGKTQEQNLEILGRLHELKLPDCPLLLGASRKSTIGNVLALPVEERLEGTLATTAVAVWQGVEFLRVHDVRANLRAAKMAAAVRDARAYFS